MSHWEEHFEWKSLIKYSEINGHILDFGCGSGNLDIILARKGYKIHGVDLSRVGIEIANYYRNKEPVGVRNNLNFECLDVLSPNLTNMLSDSIWSCHVFEHIEDPKPILLSLRNYIKPNGKVLISVPLGHAYDDPDHVNYFNSSEELIRFLGDEVKSIIKSEISKEDEVIRVLFTLK